MVFSSLEFIFRFLPIFFIVYYLTPARFRNITLFTGSLIFYALGEPTYLLLIMLSIIVNYRLGKRIAKAQKQSVGRRLLFLLSLFYNFGMLFFFKYSNFFIENINALTGYLNQEMQLTLPAIPGIAVVLPLGISFYTFQIVSYMIDVYRGQQEAENNMLDLGLYLCMFPQLIAGPIILYSDMAAQIKQREYHLADFEDGLKTFVLGLASKVLLANKIYTLWYDIQITGFDSISTPLAWIGAYAYSFQIFFDFFGYSLMAIGLGKMLGFHIPDNFNYPYISTSVSEFWRRWHMTLGSWFRDYVYIPLGGSRKGLLITIRNTFIVWALTGFWHGASWNFVLWGVLFFILISMEKLFLGKLFQKCKPLGHLYIITLIPITWILFAITNMHDLAIYLTRLFPFLNGSSPWIINATDYIYTLKNYSPLLLLCILFSTPLPAKCYRKHKNNVLMLAFLLVIFWLSIYQLVVSINNPFLYFRF